MMNCSWRQTTLGTLVASRGKSVDPSKCPNDLFELYSVPSFPVRKPEIIAGNEIGSNKQQVHSRSVLLCKINPRINRAWIVGNASKYPKIASTEWMIFPEHEGIKPSFLCYFLQQNAVRDFLAANASGVGGSLMRVKPSTLRDFPFAYPECDEQQRIVAEIEKQFTRLDAGVASLKRVQTALRRFRASVLKAACEGRLVPTEAELARKENRSYETGEQLLQRILKERRKKWNGKGKYKEPAGPATVSLPNLPQGWCWLCIDAIGFVTKLAGFEYTKFVRYSPEGDLSVIKAENAGPNGFRQTAFSKVESKTVANLTRSCLEGGELLMVFVGAGTGNVARVPEDQRYFLGPNIAMIRVLSEYLSTAYLELFLRSPLGNSLALRFAKAVAQPSLSMGTIRMIPIALPSLGEQQRIVAEVERRLSAIETLQAEVTANLQRAHRLRQSTLSKAFSRNPTT
jgi:type I restriction enzyme, S subunit